MAAKGSIASFRKFIGKRSLERFHTWIVAGLFILYVITFPLFKLTILVAIPSIMAGWFYYRRGGALISILAVILNFFLIQWWFEPGSWSTLFDFTNGFLIGHLVVILVSILVGYLREVLGNIFQLNEKLRSQERFLSLSNMMVRKILTPSHPERLFDDLVNHLTNLFIADSGYIARRDHLQGKTFLIAATNAEGMSPLHIELDLDKVKLTEDVLQTGQTLLIEDVNRTPYRINFFGQTDPTHQAQSAICVPLVAREYKFGVAILVYASPRTFTEDDRAYAERIGYQIALALWSMRQDEIGSQQLNATKALMQIGQTLGETERVGLDVVLQLIVDSARQLIPQADKTVIHLVDKDNQLLIPKAISGSLQNEKTIPFLKMSIESGAAGQALRHGTTINIADVNNDPRFLKSSVKPLYASLLVSPVQTAAKRLGTISVESQKIHAFSDHEAELLKALGAQAAIAIENTRLLESTRQSLNEVNALYKISQGLAATLDTDQLIQDVVTLLQQNFGYFHVQIFLVDPISDDLLFKRGSGEIGKKLLEQGFSIPKGSGIIGHVAKTATAFITNHVKDTSFFYPHPLLLDIQSELAVPIKVDGRVVGVLDIEHTPPHDLTDQDRQLMTAVADQLAVALQKTSLYTNLQKSLQQEQSIRSQLLQSERLALVGRLLASVSHELNNPLQAIQNALFLLKEEEGISAQGQQDLGLILSETERMAALIERLRSAYRPVQIKDFQPVHLNNLVEDVYALIATHMRHKQIAFEFLPDTDLPIVPGISDQIRQVVLNLFLNAIEIMKPGGCLTVQTQRLLSQKEVLFSVRDTGPGIDPEILPSIFEPFITGKPTGTGLGLTITQDIIQQHHGRIEAANHPEGGAIFSVWLPVDWE